MKSYVAIGNLCNLCIGYSVCVVLTYSEQGEENCSGPTRETVRLKCLFVINRPEVGKIGWGRNL